MRPRSANEKEVARLAKRIPAELTDAQRKWIERNAVPAVAYLRGKEKGAAAWCSNCGGEFSDFGHKQCPWCGARYTKHEYKPTKRVVRGKYYTTLHTTCAGWQVSRHFLVEHECRRGGNCYHSANEAVQIWTNKKGEQVINARPCRPMSRYCDEWNWREPLSIKRKHSYNYKYDICSYSNKLCSILPILKRNGFNGNFHNIMPDDLWRLLLKDNFCETLFKCGQYKLVSMIANNGSVKKDIAMICVRHNYIIKDAYMWRDYIHMAEQLGIDVHNPKYCCPADLKKEHDRVQKLKERKRQEEELLRKQETITKNEPKYAKAKGKFLGILIQSRDITIKPLQSVRAFFDEGHAMHHCVFSGEYYSKKNSLVMSATNKEGERIETVEFDLKKGRVVQSRGKCNSITSHHDEIVELVNNNSKMIYSYV